MAVSNILLMPSTAGQIEATSTAVRGASYSKAQGGNYTATIHAVDLQGRVVIEGSLSVSPTENDWFPIKFTTTNTNWVEFPYNGPSQTIDGRQVVSFPFKGNLNWIRARLERSYLDLPDNANPASYGSVYRINLTVSEGALDPATPTSGAAVSGISANHLGNGAAIVASILGSEQVTMNFRTIRPGLGLSVEQDSNYITISSDANSYTRFTGLDDTPATIVANAVLVGGSNVIAWTNAATANTTLVHNGVGFEWRPLANTVASIPVSLRGNTVTANANRLNFVGNGVSVRAVGSTAEIEIDTSNTETAYFQYTPGSAGNLNMNDCLISNTAGVTVQIIDAINCIVAFTFTGRSVPPGAIAVLGQAYQTNEFNYTNVSSAMGTRKIAGGGTAMSPTLMGAFAGPVTLQLRMSDTGASAGAGQRAKAIVMFKF